MRRWMGLWANARRDDTSWSVGVRSMWVGSSVEGITTKVTALFSPASDGRKESSRDAAEEAEAEPEADADDHVAALTDQEMEALMAQTHDEAYPLMPHVPVVVGAASCEDVVLRWRSVENDAEWPIHGYVLQRFPDAAHKLEWETLVETANASESTDRNVRISQQYLYRVQAISGAARSSFAYHAVSMNQSTCHLSRSLLAYLPTAFHVIPYIDSLSIEAVQTFVLIISCFLAVFGVMRSNVKRVQHTRSRQGRLRKMEKSTQAEHSASKLYTLPRLSSSEASTDQSTSAHEHFVSSRSSQFESSGSVGGLNLGASSRHAGVLTRDDFAPRAASFSTSLDKSVCQYCHKKFGLFRRRRVCDVCEAVALCRKCGVHASRTMTVDALRESFLNAPPTLAPAPTPRITKAKSEHTRRPKTVCRDCSAHAQRFSTSMARPLR